MDELNRVQIASDLLDEAHTLSQDYSASEQIEVLYNFLLSNEYDNSGINETLTRTHDVSYRLLQVYKRDAWMIILLDGYEYLKYLQATTGITEEASAILLELENIQCTFTELYEYFVNPNNKDKIKILIDKYYEYIARGEAYAKLCGDYNYEHQSDYRNILTDYIGNVAVMDRIATIFSLLDDKYQGQINVVVTGDEDAESYEHSEEEMAEYAEYEENEEDFDEEEYEQAVDELFEGHEEEVKQILENFKTDLHTQIMDCLEGFFDDKFECDDFIGFFMSYVYISLIKYEGRLLKEEEAILRLLKNPEVGFPLIVETFYDNRDYVLSALDVFTKYYFKHHCDILTHRDDLSSEFEYDRVSAMDKNFPEREKDNTVKIISNPLYEVYDMIFAKYKLDYPEDYLERLYSSIMSDSEIEAIFYELGIESDIMHHRVHMIRYFSRKFIERVHMDPLGVNEKELFTAVPLGSDNITLINIINNFRKNGITILKGYEYIMGKTDSELKESIRGYNGEVELKRVFKIDPTVLSDSIYYRAFTDSNLYQYLEKNGIDRTVKYLIELASTDYPEAREWINEIMVSIYTHTKESDNKDSVEQTIALIYEVDTSDVEAYIKTVLGSDMMLSQLINKYYEYEKEDDFPISYEERVVQFPKIKQKLYPKPNE